LIFTILLVVEKKRGKKMKKNENYVRENNET